MKTVTIEIMDDYDEVMTFTCVGQANDGMRVTNVITKAVRLKDNLHLKQVYDGKIGNDGFKQTHFIAI